MACMFWVPEGPLRFIMEALAVMGDTVFELVVHEELELWTSLSHCWRFTTAPRLLEFV